MYYESTIELKADASPLVYFCAVLHSNQVEVKLSLQPETATDNDEVLYVSKEWLGK